MKAIAILRRHARLAGVRVRARIGPSGAVGLLLLAVAAAAAWWTPRVAEDAASLHRQYEVEGMRLRNQWLQRTPDPAAQLDEFQAGFPPASQNLADLRLIFRVAREQRIALPHGDYVAVRRTETRLKTSDVVLPVHGSYPSIRAFVASILNDLPHASLAELRMERAAGDQVDARVHLTLYYREG